jgi:hypothetical protein
MTHQYAPCGIDCSYCDVYKATLNDDNEARLKLAQAYKDDFGQEVDPATIVCHGCRGEGQPLCYATICKIRACVLGKGYDTCAECGEFPCQTGEFLWQRNKYAKMAIEQLKRTLSTK